MSVGPLEIVIVLVLALLVFGPNRLPQAGRSLGRAMREFRKATQTARTELGLDELTAGLDDLKASVGVDDLKSSMSVDLKSGATTPSRSSAAAAAAVAAPAVDKPVTVAASVSDTTPVELPGAEAPADQPAEEPSASDAADAPAGDLPPADRPIPVAATVSDVTPPNSPGADVATDEPHADAVADATVTARGDA